MTWYLQFLSWTSAETVFSMISISRNRRQSLAKLCVGNRIMSNTRWNRAMPCGSDLLTFILRWIFTVRKRSVTCLFVQRWTMYTFDTQAFQTDKTTSVKYSIYYYGTKPTQKQQQLKYKVIFSAFSFHCIGLISYIFAFLMHTTCELGIEERKGELLSQSRKQKNLHGGFVLSKAL